MENISKEEELGFSRYSSEIIPVSEHPLLDIVTHYRIQVKDTRLKKMLSMNVLPENIFTQGQKVIDNCIEALKELEQRISNEI